MIVKDYTIEEALDNKWKQIYELKEAEGQEVKTIAITEWNSSIWIVFKNNTFLHFIAEEGDDDNGYFHIGGKYTKGESFRNLYTLSYGGKTGATAANPLVELSKLGIALNADPKKLKEMHLEHQRLAVKAREDQEYQQYLHLKEKYGN